MINTLYLSIHVHQGYPEYSDYPRMSTHDQPSIRIHQGYPDYPGLRISTYMTDSLCLSICVHQGYADYLGLSEDIHPWLTPRVWVWVSMYTKDTQTILDYPRMYTHDQPPVTEYPCTQGYPDYPRLSEDVHPWPTPVTEYPCTPRIPRLSWNVRGCTPMTNPSVIKYLCMTIQGYPPMTNPSIHVHTQTILECPRMYTPVSEHLSTLRISGLILPNISLAIAGSGTKHFWDILVCIHVHIYYYCALLNHMLYIDCWLNDKNM